MLVSDLFRTGKGTERQYREGMNYRYLLDEMMGMNKRSHVTNGVQGLALDLASTVPYQRSADVLRKTSAIDMTHQTIWRLVAKTADPYLKTAEQERKWFQQTGEMPASDGKQLVRLMVEADGVMLSLQRERSEKLKLSWGLRMKDGRGSVKTGTRLSIRPYLRR